MIPRPGCQSPLLVINLHECEPQVVQRVAELTKGIQAQAAVSAEQILKELNKIGFREPEGKVRASDQVNALDKMAKIMGLYRDDRPDPNQHLINIRHVTGTASRKSSKSGRLALRVSTYQW